jgi:hypothetical protein
MTEQRRRQRRSGWMDGYVGSFWRPAEAWAAHMNEGLHERLLRRLAAPGIEVRIVGEEEPLRDS